MESELKLFYKDNKLTGIEVYINNVVVYANMLLHPVKLGYDKVEEYSYNSAKTLRSDLLEVFELKHILPDSLVRYLDILTYEGK